MNELEKDFYSPVIDFFPEGTENPHDVSGGVRLRGVRYKSDGVDLLYREGSSRLPLGAVVRDHKNDLGGLSLEFSESVRYLGNSGGIGLLVSKDRWHTLTYDEVGRVRKPNGAPVWENYGIPKEKRLLTDSS